MTAKEELSQYWHKAKKVEQTLQDYELYKTRAEKMTALISETTSRTNLTSDKVGDNAIMMAELSIKYKLRWLEAEKELNRITENINRVSEPYRSILYFRYARLYDFNKVAEEVGYSYDRTVHLHGIALREYDKYKEEI